MSCKRIVVCLKQSSLWANVSNLQSAGSLKQQLQVQFVLEEIPTMKFCQKEVRLFEWKEAETEEM